MAPLLNYGPRLRRFAYTPPEEDAKLNILEGSVRSGKTWALIPKILYACRYPVRGWRIITGVSKSSIFVNVLNDLFDFVGPSNYTYNQQSGLLKLCKSNWIVKGAIDEGSEKYIRGMTVAVAICDEVTLMPREFFNMLLTRMSPPGARLYATTNTDSPLHWLKTEYLDNEELRKGGLLFSMHCTMDDNPNLSPEFVESQKKFFKGLFYARLIEGKWVMAEGGIYRDVWNRSLIYTDSERPIGLRNPGGYKDRWISIDPGVDHPQVYLEFYDDGNIIWVDREWCWDSRKEMRQLTDQQYADKLIQWIGPNRGPRIIVPPEAASFKAELWSRRLWVTDADSAVKEGIKTVTSIMGRQMIRIHESCKGLIRQIETYAWDPQAAKHGDEKPLKSNDDFVDCLRYGLHDKIPMWRIMGASMKVPIILPQRNV